MEARQLSSPADAFQLSLRIRHPSMDPRDISHELHMPSQFSFRAGEARDKRGRTSGVGSHAESYWFAPLDPELWESDADVNVQPFSTGTRTLELGLLRSALLLRRHAEFLRRIHAEGGDVSLLVEISPLAVTGFSLSPGCASTFSELGVVVDFEFMH